MKRIGSLIIIALVLSTVQAQSWFGLRSGYPLGVTLHYGTSAIRFTRRSGGV